MVLIGLNFIQCIDLPDITNVQREINRNYFLENFKYRFQKLNGQSKFEKGKSPNRTNLMHIARYKYRLNEGTSPGLLKSFNYYLNPFTSIFI